MLDAAVSHQHAVCVGLAAGTFAGSISGPVGASESGKNCSSKSPYVPAGKDAL